MPILGNDYVPPSNAPTGLVLGGQGPYVPRPPQRELTLGEMGNVGLQGIGAALDIPRLLAYNAGPAMVGRAGQGPQTGAEALQRLGLDYNSPAQRAIGHGAGAGLDMLANPLGLLGMGAGRAAPAAAEGQLARRLEQFAGPGLADTLSGASNLHGPGGRTNIALMELPTRPLSPFAGRMPASARAVGPMAPGVPPRPVTPATDFEMLRQQQLNSPTYNPAMAAPGDALGTSAFSQQVRMGQGQTSANLADRLARMSARPQQPATVPAPPPAPFPEIPGLSGLRAGIQVDSEGTPVVRSLADQLRIQQRQGLPTVPEAAGGFRGGTALNSTPSLQPPRPMTSAPDGPGLFPGAPNLTAHDLGVAPSQMFPPSPTAAVPGGIPPTYRPEYSPAQFRAFWEAVNNPGRGNTLPPGRFPTLPNGPIDY